MPIVALRLGGLLAVVMLAGALLAGIPRIARAQPGLTSGAQVVPIDATKPSTLTISISSGAVQTIASLIDNSFNTFATPVRIAAAWSVSPVLTSDVRLLAYFGTPAQALASGTNYITSSRVEGRVLTAPATAWQPTSWTAFTGNATNGVGTNGGTLPLFLIPISSANASGSRAFDLELQLDLRGVPSLAAGTYSGTITLRAVTS